MSYDLRVYSDIASLQARIMELERMVKATEQTEAKLRDLESRLEEFGIKLRSAQEGSGAF